MSTTIPPNNNTGLYNSTSNPVPVNDNILANNISATGNVTVDGYIYSAGSITTNSNFVGNLIGNVTLPTSNTQVVYNNSGAFGGTPAFTFNQATDVLSVTGNIAGGYFLGNGSQLTGLPQSYGNSNVVTLLAGFGSNTVSTTGNITAGSVLGNGSQLTGLPATYGNSNVATFLPTYSGNLNPNTISATGNVTGQNLKTSGTSGNIVGANYVSAGYFVGDGGLLTNVVATSSYGNSNVAAYLPTYGGTVLANLINFTNNSGVIEQGDQRITITGNATQVNTGAYFNDTGEAAIFANSYVAIATNTTSNVNPTWTFDQFGNLSAPGNISAVGNIEAPYYFGNGSQLTGIAAGYGNSNVTTLLASFGSNTISTSGNITARYLFGNGSQLTGIAASYGNANVNTLLAAWGSNILSTTGNVTAGYHIGNGSLLTSLTGANVSGTVANATYAVTSGSATTAGTVTTNAQPNITSVGILSSVSITGNVDAGNLRTAGQVSATGNINAGSLVIPSNGKIYGDFSNLTSSQRVVFQNNGNSFTSIGAIPGGTYSAVGQTIASLAAFNITDVGNASFGVIRHYGTYVQMGSAKNGTGGNMPVAIVVGGGGTANVAGNAIVLDTAYNATVTGNINTSNNATIGGTFTFANIARSGGTPTAATDLIIAYKIPITINGVTYYIALTAGV